jgi:hypothetical protein
MKNKLNFKNWIINEFADYGKGGFFTTKIKGGTSRMVGSNVFDTFKVDAMLESLKSMPPIGTFEPRHSWSNIIEYGDDFGALKVIAQPYGSFRLLIKQKISDLQGVPTWILKQTMPICDFKDLGLESMIADNLYKSLVEINKQQVSSCDKNYNLEELAKKLWAGLKINHPSYIMFPYSFRKQNENLYKFVFEMKGHGIGTPSQNSTGRTEQFNIDLYWDENKGLIRCWGYDISSNINKHMWNVGLSEWDEYFSPHDKLENIVINICANFMQY